VITVLNSVNKCFYVGKRFFPQDDIPVESPSTSPSKRRDSVGQVSDDDDIGDDEDSKVRVI
jgi:hypothetical protein